MPARIVVLVSGSGSNMLALHDACRRGHVPGEIAGVVADRPCRGLDRAEERGIPVTLVPLDAHSTRADWNVAMREAVLAMRPDLVVAAGFMRVFAPSFVDALNGRLINLHPALLPSFPGAHAVRDALAAGVDVTGSTVHFIDHEVDHGSVIVQERVPVEPGDTEESLHARIKAVEHRLLPRACVTVLERLASAPPLGARR
ncbi:phosphoribosylglycinamide formyltransferase [soil metagenome]